ncbi:MAG: serine hydroxymethyltransferase [Planctomycetota bacterium]|jgi:glycine hydroxymethyltransferase|nr:serine hydroxymethyltransferase [Planctomycetota bacterium]
MSTDTTLNHTAPQNLATIDPEMAAIVQAEFDRQQHTIELIASENLASTAVMEAQGSVLTNKYAEGYPGRRYYGGCEEVDKAEELAKKRAQALFKTDYYVNVQAHSGSQANNAAYLAAGMTPGDRVLGMSLDHGGHLTHGFRLNFSGRDYETAAYGVERDTGAIDYDKLAAQAKEFKPKLLIAGASNYSRVIDFERFAAIAKDVGAVLLVDMAHIAGLVAAGLHPSPFGHADLVTTTTHKTLRGPRGGMVFARDLELQKKVNSRVFPGLQGGPLMHVIAAKAVAFGEALKPEYATYMKRVQDSASAMADRFIEQGWQVVSGGTDNHLFSLNVMSQGVTGKEAEDLLHSVGITVNKNLIPYDEQPAQTASGIRIGTPAVCSRGFGVSEAVQIADLIDRALKARGDAAALEAVGKDVRALCDRFPIY